MRPAPNPLIEVIRRHDLEEEQTGKAHYGSRMGIFAFANDRGEIVRMISGVGYGWEHVSVSLESRTPTWEEMCRVKDLFWSEDETVVQFHPRRSEYVNCHPHCLHLWKPMRGGLDLPPSKLVGPKS